MAGGGKALALGIYGDSEQLTQSRNVLCTSLKGGLLRLMMAGCVYAVIGPTGFWLGFVISEIIALLSSITKEGLLMVKKVFNEMLAYAKRIKARFIASWEAHLPSGQSPLMSLCKSSEKVASDVSNNSFKPNPHR